MLKKGHHIKLLNMDGNRFSSEEENRKVERIAMKLLELHPGRVTLLRADHGINLGSFKENSNPKYMCILCKKAMLMVADLVCDRFQLEGIVMGDSLGQVASQTLPNMAAVSRGIRHPIIRPLIGFDKLDIEHIAKEAGTYDISIKATTGCTAAPRHPITNAISDRLEEEARKASIVKTVTESADSVRIIDLS
jgi:thiamine biosynthesis protein ThiI